MQAAMDLSSTFFEFQRNQLDNQIMGLEFAAQRELELAGNNEEAKRAIEERTAQKIRELRQKQARNEKAQGIFSTIIQTAQAVVRALASPGGIVLAGIVGALGAAQTAAIASQPIPRFARGTKRVPGRMTGTDSVHALLMPGEGVMPVDRMNKYAPAFDAIYDRKIHPDIINGFVQQATGKEVFSKEVIKDSTSINIDHRGFLLYQQKGLNRLKKQTHKFSMSG
jgi:hypothetical protein